MQLRDDKEKQSKISKYIKAKEKNRGVLRKRENDRKKEMKCMGSESILSDGSTCEF